MSIASILREEDFWDIYGKLSQWRIDRFISSGTEKGEILRFVRGLRFSALLIYAIREILSGTDLEVDWGHIVGKDIWFMRMRYNHSS